MTYEEIVEMVHYHKSDRCCALCKHCEAVFDRDDFYWFHICHGKQWKLADQDEIGVTHGNEGHFARVNPENTCDRWRAKEEGQTGAL